MWNHSKVSGDCFLSLSKTKNATLSQLRWLSFAGIRCSLTSLNLRICRSAVAVSCNFSRRRHRRRWRLISWDKFRSQHNSSRSYGYKIVQIFPLVYGQILINSRRHKVTWIPCSIRQCWTNNRYSILLQLIIRFWKNCLRFASSNCTVVSLTLCTFENGLFKLFNAWWGCFVRTFLWNSLRRFAASGRQCSIFLKKFKFK